MSFYNRRNAAVGYLTIKALQREVEKRRGRRRSGFKVAAYVGLGLVSAGILAAALAVALKRRQSEQGEVATPESETSEIVGEYVTAPEPIPAT
jgi:hypothetical protein